MHDSTKKNRQFQFAVDLNWLEENRGIITSDMVSSKLFVSPPSCFGGDGIDWSPEDLLLSAISSCFMTTFLYFANRMELEISRLECHTSGVVETVEGKLRFTDLHVEPKIYVAFAEGQEKAVEVLKKTQEYCLISNTVNIPVTYNAQILKVGSFARIWA
ncbi:MAG TPA: OsmC family protein [Chitinophagaceae bacterium]